KFVDDTLVIKNEYSLHVLNYNSPGATGALPIAAMIVNELIEDGKLSFPPKASPHLVSNSVSLKNNNKPMWDIAAISENLRAPSQ
ncbi:MAG TPA: hypothetical protein VFI70_10855, partial [Nitrososphaeraceae archaeon]|nr:hypothetical protein [Nitrososphaeraceae archaeon]